MNFPKKILNAFSATEVRRVTGLSIHMIDYLARERYLNPTYGKSRVRGKVRYYSYRDLVVARIVQRLLATGLEIRRLKESIQLLSHDKTWLPDRSFDLLATDGRQLYYSDRNGSLIELTRGAQQHAFTFVLDVAQTKHDVRQRITREKRRLFSMENRPLVPAIAKRKSTTR